jgi:hypothetical protein
MEWAATSKVEMPVTSTGLGAVLVMVLELVAVAVAVVKWIQHWLRVIGLVLWMLRLAPVIGGWLL